LSPIRGMSRAIESLRAAKEVVQKQVDIVLEAVSSAERQGLLQTELRVSYNNPGSGKALELALSDHGYTARVEIMDDVFRVRVAWDRPTAGANNNG
jgi:hypothetical protein